MNVSMRTGRMKCPAHSGGVLAFGVKHASGTGRPTYANFEPKHRLVRSDIAGIIGFVEKRSWPEARSR